MMVVDRSLGSCELNMKWLKQYFGGILVVAVIIGIRFEQDLQDGIKLLKYQPTPEVAKLTTATRMTDTARRLFYVNQPQIESRKSALNRCQATEHTVVLGCYVVGTGIFLQAVSDPRLQGIVEVSAAHEMLHVAYQRMSVVEQLQINKLLRTSFEQLQNPRIKRLIETYKSQDPRSVDSELHSLFGTEVRHLVPELEQHYRKYFTDRSTVVALSEQYEEVFTNLQTKSKRLSEQLAIQKPALAEFASRVKQEGENVERDRINLQSILETNLPADYRDLVANFNNRVENFNQLLAQLKERERIYNQMVNEYNSFALEEKSLIDSLQNKSSPQINK